MGPPCGALVPAPHGGVVNTIIWTPRSDLSLAATLYGFEPGTRLLLWLECGETIEAEWLPSPGDGGRPVTVIATGRRIGWDTVLTGLSFVELITGGPVWDGALLVETPGGRRWVRTMAASYLDSAGGPNLLASEIAALGPVSVLCDRDGHWAGPRLHVVLPADR